MPIQSLPLNWQRYITSAAVKIPLLLCPPLVCRTPVRCGSVVRLQHLQTKKFLHSHFFSSPLSHNQEVSAFGDGEREGDEGDNWTVDCSSDYWNRDEAIRLKHAATER